MPRAKWTSEWSRASGTGTPRSSRRHRGIRLLHLSLGFGGRRPPGLTELVPTRYAFRGIPVLLCRRWPSRHRHRHRHPAACGTTRVAAQTGPLEGLEHEA